MEKLPIVKSNICNFAFVASNIEIPDYIEPIKLPENLCFKKPSPEQIECIRYIIRGTTPRYSNVLIPYEMKIIRQEKENGVSFDSYQLDETDWRYWIIEYKGNGIEVFYISQLMLLLKSDLELAGYFSFREKKCSGMQLISRDVYERFFTRIAIDMNVLATLNIQDIQKIGEYYKLWKSLIDNHSFIKQSVTGFQQLKWVPSHSMIFTVGLFSIIECLVTYRDQKRRNPHSISHQISTKLILLNKKFERRMDMSDYFLPANDDTIWNTLYGYRSTIAHGDVPDFSEKNKILKDANTINDFLRETIKNLIILGLNEPEFLSDLRKC